MKLASARRIQYTGISERKETCWKGSSYLCNAFVIKPVESTCKWSVLLRAVLSRYLVSKCATSRNTRPCHQGPIGGGEWRERTLDISALGRPPDRPPALQQ